MKSLVPTQLRGGHSLSSFFSQFTKRWQRQTLTTKGVPCTLSYEKDRAIKRIHRNYQIPNYVTFKLPNSNKWECSSSRDKVSFNEGAFKGGHRFPMHRLNREFLGFLSISPAKLAPNAWQMMISSIIIQSTSNKGEDLFTLEKLLYCYRPSQGKKVGYWYLSSRETGRSTITNMPSSNRIQTMSFFILSGVGREHHVRVQINAGASLCGKMKGLDD